MSHRSSPLEPDPNGSEFFVEDPTELLLSDLWAYGGGRRRLRWFEERIRGQPAWLRRFVLRPIYRNVCMWGGRLTKLQYIVLALVLGAVGGLIATAYGVVLSLVMDALWVRLPQLLADRTPVFDVVPPWTFIIVVCVLLGLAMGAVRLVLPEPGEMNEMIKDIRSRGMTRARDLLPVIVLTFVSIVSGSSVGPEAAVILAASNLGALFIPFLTSSVESRRILTFCLQGAALSAFFNLPVSGALFVIEIQTRENLEYTEAATATVLASVVGVLVSSSITGDSIGDHLTFSEDPSGGSLLLLEGLAIGVLGAALAIWFTLMMVVPKRVLGPVMHPRHPVRARLMSFLMPVAASVFIGVCAALFPPTLFWSEKEIATCVSNGAIPLPHMKLHGIVPILNDDGSYVWWSWGVVGALKLVLIAVSLHAGFVGGIIFPLFYAGFCFGQFLTSLQSVIPGAFVMLALAGALESAVTRTPFGTALALTIMRRMTNPMETAMLPGILVASFTAMLLTTDSVRILRSQSHRFGWGLLRNLQEEDSCIDVRAISSAELDNMAALVEKVRSVKLARKQLASLGVDTDGDGVDDDDCDSDAVVDTRVVEVDRGLQSAALSSSSSLRYDRELDGSNVTFVNVGAINDQ